MSLWDRLENIDSRIIYSLVFIVLAIPIIQPVGLPLKISPLTQEAYDIIDTMPPGSKVLYQVYISWMYGRNGAPSRSYYPASIRKGP
jgi:hypothetical protein